MYYVMRTFAPSLHRKSTDFLIAIYKVESYLDTWQNFNIIVLCLWRVYAAILYILTHTHTIGIQHTLEYYTIIIVAVHYSYKFNMINNY